MIQHMDNVLTVPLVAVMDDGDGPYVNMVTVTRRAIPAKRVPVTVKAQTRRPHGLVAGTEVMIGGGAMAHPGRSYGCCSVGRNVRCNASGS